MIKLVYCFSKAAHLTHEEFLHYWQNVHAPLAAKIPGLRGLVQNIPLEPADGDSKRAGFDGIAELWFEDVESLAAARKSDAWSRSTADEAHFIDPDGAILFMASERRVL